MLSSGSAVAAVALVDEAVGMGGVVKNGGGSGGEGLGRPMAEEVVGCQGSDSERTISDGTGELPSFLVRSE